MQSPTCFLEAGFNSKTATMRATLIFGLPFLAITAAQSTGKLGDAAVVTNNPAGATYKATLPEKSSTKVRGFVTISSGAGGKGASYVINLTGLPTSGGPFSMTYLLLVWDHDL